MDAYAGSPESIRAFRQAFEDAWREAFPDEDRLMTMADLGTVVLIMSRLKREKFPPVHPLMKDE